MIAADTNSSESVISVQGLTRRFGTKVALDAVNLRVPRGTVFGLVGVNGAGKTTFIRHILGLLKAQSGSVRVFERDPVADPVGVLSRVGYLSEENDLPGWMRVEELLRFSRSFYPRWDDGFAEELRRSFALDLQARVKNLSKGQRARVGLLIALAYRPELLVLDEPSSGLDPVVRHDILGAIIRTIAEEGRTVLFSSHLLEEVERVSDHVTMLHHGKVVFSGALDDIKATHRRLTIRFAEARSGPPAVPGVTSWKGTGREWTAFCNLGPGEAQAVLSRDGGSVVDERLPSLDEIFVAQVGTKCVAAEEV
jgi:ABC-2 type transport system ATP-binding protein